MEKQTTNNFRFLNNNQSQFEDNRKNISRKKNHRYIYTEEDLGEGILDVGINTAANFKGKPNSQLWASMLKPYWS
jgi:hypothetical protein